MSNSGLNQKTRPIFFFRAHTWSIFLCLQFFSGGPIWAFPEQQPASSDVNTEEEPPPALKKTTPVPEAKAVQLAPQTSELELFELEERTSQYAAKIITASRTEEESGESPATVTVLTHEDISRLGVTTLEELLNYVPGFQVTRDVEQGNAFRIGVRGRAKFNSEYVLVLLNGQRLNDIYTGGVTLINRYIAVDHIKQIEVIRGPGSALYGSGAFLGVINIVTFTQHENKVSIHYGTQNAISTRISISKELGPVEIYGFARYYADEGYLYRNVRDTYNSVGDTRDPVKTFDFFGSMKWNGLSVQIRHSEHRVEDFLAFGVLQNYSGNDLQRQTSLGINFDRKMHDLVSLNVFGGVLYDRWRAINTAIPPDTVLPDGSVLARTLTAGPLLDSFQIGVGASVRITPVKSNELIVGVGYDHLNLLSAVNLTNQNLLTGESIGSVIELSGEYSFNDPHQRNIVSAFVQDRQKIGKWVQLTGGLRLDYYDDIGIALSPRFAGVITTPIQTSFKFIYGKAFRAPSFLELYDKNNPVDFGNQNLRPEDIHTFEINATQNHKYFYVSANYFHNIIQNLVDYGPPVQDSRNQYNSPTFINTVDTKNTDGLEFDLSVKPIQRKNHSLLFRGTLTYLINIDNNPMPSLFGSFQANYRIWKLMFDLNGIVRQSIDRLPEQPSYVVLNFNALAEITDKVQLQATFRNLLNQEYRTLTLPLGTGVPNRGFNCLLGLQLKL